MNRFFHPNFSRAPQISVNRAAAPQPLRIGNPYPSAEGRYMAMGPQMHIGNTGHQMPENMEGVSSAPSSQAPAFEQQLYSEQLVNNEVRSIFLPYAQSSTQSIQNNPATSNAFLEAPHGSRTPYTAQLNAIRLQSRENPSKRRRTAPPCPPVKIKQLQVCFLGSKDEVTRPNQDRRIELGVNGLGDATVSFGDQANFSEIYNAIVHSFSTQILPMINGETETLAAIEFGIFYSKGQGNARQKLIPFRPSYNASDIKTLGINCLYIKPSVTLLKEEDADLEGDNESENSSESDENNQSSANGNQSSNENVPVVVVAEARSSSGSNNTAGFQWPSAETFIDSRDFEELVRLLRVAYPEPQIIDVPKMGEISAEEIVRFRDEILPYQKTRVNIQGEPRTVDLGGPLRAYVTKLMTASAETTFQGVAILVGPNCYLTVNDDMKLIDGKIWSAFANFMAFSAMNTGIAFVGLSRPLVSYICSKDGTCDVPIKTDDIPIIPVKTAVLELEQRIQNEEYEISKEQQESINFWLNIFHHTICFNEDPAEAVRILKEQSVISHRKMALEALRIAFQTTPFGSWVASHPESHESLFPRCVETNVADFIANVQVTDENAVMITFLHEYMLGWVNAGQKVSTIIELLTGFPTFTDNSRSLSVMIDTDLRTFKASTCGGILKVCPVKSYAEFEEKMNELIANGSDGFNDV